MQIDRLQAVLRQRTSYEAIDLGFAMARTWLGPIYRAWLPITLPVYVLVWALLQGAPLWGFLLLWWLKPLWDRIPLYVVSRALFGDVPKRGETIRAMPKVLTRRLFHTLGLFRLSPTRSFSLPVLQLEGGDAKAQGRRRSALLRTMSIPAAWLTLLCLVLEVVVFVGLLGLVMIMLPDRPELSLSVLWSEFWEGQTPLWLKIAIPAASYLATSIVEPLYVSAGFSLYLSRRTQLEGWDIELTFRRIAARLRATGRIAGAALLIALVTLPLFPPVAQAQPADAQPGTPLPAEASDEEAAIREVLSRPEFPHKVRQEVWRAKQRGGRDLGRGCDGRTPGSGPALGGLGRLMAALLEGVLWVIGGVVLAALVLLIFSRLRKLGPRPQRSGREPLPKATVGRHKKVLLELPDDLAAAARALIAQGRTAEALSLLYRGALKVLIDERAILIEENATEGECLRIITREAPEPVATFFAALTRAWQEEAYAHRAVDEPRLLELCDGWPRHFRGASR